MKNFTLMLLGLLFAMALASCGNDSGTSGSSSAVGASLTDIPRVTGPVVSSGLMSLSKNYYSLDAAIESATTGTLFYGATIDLFTPSTGKSRAMCEIMNVSKQLLDDAAKADQILCYVQTVLANSANAAAATAAGISDLYDGVEHKMTVSMGSGEGGKVKMQLTKTNGVITSFKMYECMDSGGVTQDGYRTITIGTDRSVTISSKNIRSEDGNSWKNSMSVVGTLDTSYRFVSKTITGVSWGTYTAGGSNTFASKAVMSQGSNAMTFKAYQKNSMNGGTYTNDNKVASKFQLIDTNSDSGVYNMHLIAIGDGSVVGHMTSTAPGDNNWDNDISESWTGDDRGVLGTASNGMHYAATAVAADENTLTDPTAEGSGLAFGAGETWDCEGSDFTVTADDAELQASCGNYSLRTSESEQNWMNCWDEFSPH